MYTLSRKVIIRKWGRAGPSVHFSLYRHGEEAAGSQDPKESKAHEGRFLSMRAAHPFLIYSI